MSNAGKDEPQTSAGRKAASAPATGARPQPSPPQEPALKCPRCDSPNTKFCYYNNYSLTQPRHFCKTCRRYWTKGGALRNVPIGGGCRKNKKMKSSTHGGLDVSSRDSMGGPDIGGLKFFQGVSPAMDFQISFPPRLHHSGTNAAGLFNHFSPNPGDANPNFNLLDLNPAGGVSSPLIGFASFPLSAGINQEMGALNVNSSLASSIESLSSINQDLHWKLQQQRLGIIPSMEQQLLTINQKPQPQPIMFDISRQDQSCARKDHQGLSTEWFFDNSFTPMAQQTTPPSSGSNWTGIQTWNSDLGQYTASSLP